MWYDYPEINEQLGKVEEIIRKNIKTRNSLLKNVVEGLVSAGGKRLRPAFVILSSKFGPKNNDNILNVAGAIEILHTATLVHDDIVDRSMLRRGKTTVANDYGLDMAVYTGDFLLTVAVLMLSGNIENDKLELIAKAVKAICEGEIEQYRDKYNINTSILSYLKKIRRKTAILFAIACAVGAELSECTAETKRNLTKYGFYYGMAFQIRDDLNDFLSDEKTSGKPVGKDIKEGILTLPVIYAVARNKEVRNIFSEYMSKKDKITLGEISQLVDLVIENKGVEDTKKFLDKYVDRGLGVLEKLPDITYKNIFRDLILNLRSF